MVVNSLGKWDDEEKNRDMLEKIRKYASVIPEKIEKEEYMNSYQPEYSGASSNGTVERKVE